MCGSPAFVIPRQRIWVSILGFGFSGLGDVEASWSHVPLLRIDSSTRQIGDLQPVGTRNKFVRFAFQLSRCRIQPTISAPEAKTLQ